VKWKVLDFGDEPPEVCHTISLFLVFYFEDTIELMLPLSLDVASSRLILLHLVQDNGRLSGLMI